jgi:glycosyltransferase involved in cell wall biosynthesis
MVSGENIVVLGQIKALNAYGHEVKLFSRHTDIEQKKFFFAARSGYRVISGSGFNFKKDIKDFNPDLVLVHNLFPNISSRWVERVVARRIIFLHNFRPWCSNGNMLRDGNHCQKCLRNRFWGTFYSCANGSLFRSFVQSLGQVFNNYLSRLEKSGATIVAVSEGSQEKIREFNTISRLEVLSNFVSVPEGLTTLTIPDGHSASSQFVWTGRVSKEKGLAELLRIWPDHFRLDIFGGGPDLIELSKIFEGSTNITFKGTVSNEILREKLPYYWGLVNSSTWLESGPMTVIEALSVGVPIIFPTTLPIGLLITKNKAGIAYSLTDSTSLTSALQEISNAKNRIAYQKSSYNLFISQFSVDKWYKSLMEIYRKP